MSTCKLKKKVANINLTHFRFGQQTDESVPTTPEQTPNMSNYRPPFGPPGPYAPYYNYGQPTQHGYGHVPPYPPTTPYGMPSPAPGMTPTIPNYAYFPPHMQEPPYIQPPYIQSPMYSQPVPFNQTRLASPSPYAGYPPPRIVQPTYNYSTTNMISRPPRPASIYPQLTQHTYPPLQNNNVTGPVNIAQSARPDSVKDVAEANNSRKSSEVSIAVSTIL